MAPDRARWTWTRTSGSPRTHRFPRRPLRSALATGVLALALASLAWPGPGLDADAASAGFSPAVSEDGAIGLPADFRSTLTHLGSWYVPEGDASGFHDVYVSPEAVDAYRRDGRFPDGAVLVKELRAASAGDYTTGEDVKYANDTVKQWFVMVKDGQGRFPGNPLWGEGWGWALFKPDDPAKNVATSYQADCLGCHLPARKTDYVYTEAYPTLAR